MELAAEGAGNTDDFSMLIVQRRNVYDSQNFWQCDYKMPDHKKNSVAGRKGGHIMLRLGRVSGTIPAGNSRLRIGLLLGVLSKGLTGKGLSTTVRAL